MKVPQAFEQRILRIYGVLGSTWLASLDSLLAAVEMRFGLENVVLMEDLSYNLVAQAESDSYGPCVLKLSLEGEALRREAHALEYYQGNAAVRLLDKDFSFGALVLELLEPGESLKQFFPQQDEKATEIAASVIKVLHANPEEPEGFPSLKQWLTPLFDRGYGALSEYDKAQGIARELLSVDDELHVCHGDLHHGNILASSRGWVSIDPKGVVAPTWFEIGCFMSNPLTLLDYNAKHSIERRFDQFSELLAIDRELLVASSYVYAVLAACWSLEEGSDREVAYFLRCAQLIVS